MVLRESYGSYELSKSVYYQIAHQEMLRNPVAQFSCISVLSILILKFFKKKDMIYSARYDNE